MTTTTISSPAASTRPVITAYAVITFLTAWKMYLWPVIVVRSEDLKVLPMVIAELSANSSQDRGVMMAAVALSILPILLLYIGRNAGSSRALP